MNSPGIGTAPSLVAVASIDAKEARTTNAKSSSDFALSLAHLRSPMCHSDGRCCGY
jgi:hypothetical protein